MGNNKINLMKEVKKKKMLNAKLKRYLARSHAQPHQIFALYIYIYIYILMIIHLLLLITNQHESKKTL